MPVSALQHVQRPSPCSRPGGADLERQEEADFDRCDTAVRAALDSWDVGVERLEVTGAGRRIPYYFLSPAGNGRRPTVIISEGSDGQNVETMQFGGAGGLERGYNVVLFEGPGQMSLLFKKRIPFTAQWDEVVSPIVKEVRARDDVGSAAVVGISFGGMLCARGCPDSRVDAVVLQPGAYSFRTGTRRTSIWSVRSRTHPRPNSARPPRS